MLQRVFSLPSYEAENLIHFLDSASEGFIEYNAVIKRLRG